MHLINERKLNAIEAAREMLVDVVDLAADSEVSEQILDKLDQIDEYLRYIQHLEEFDSVHGKRPVHGKGYLYHLIKKHRRLQ